MRKATYLALASTLATLTLSGCLPVLVGGLIYKSTHSREQKQAFVTEYRRANAEREAKGLKALDWCEEVYRFDKGWAYEDHTCRGRLKELEAGRSSTQ